MFLKSVPPAVAIHTDWRSGSQPQHLSLPLCFHDSDSSLSSGSGVSTTIPKKVQMIIESLRSTQSSSDMSVECHVEGAGPACSRDLLRQSGCKAKQGHDPKSRSGVTDSKVLPKALLSDEEPGSSDSDSDSSVDRGIEEAIQEYLKEKVDHKQKEDPVGSQPPACKLARRDPPNALRQPQVSDSNNVLMASNHFLKAPKGNVPLALTPKKKVKKKTPSKENPSQKTVVTEGAVLSILRNLPSFSTNKGSADSLLCVNQVQQTFPSLDKEPSVHSSSSDDGIEEEIQRFQLQKTQEILDRRTESFRPLNKPEDCDSSSDDGIEEAIQRFQKEKRRKQKKHVLKPKLMELKQTSPGSKTSILSLNQISAQSVKKASGLSRAKKKRMERPMPSLSPVRPTYVTQSPCDNMNGRSGDPEESVVEAPPPPLLKVNTTAELMCAEAILDISKAVMPLSFEPSIALSTPSTLEPPSIAPAGLSVPSEVKSDDGSSIDSEDGIELEIRKFLEQKAQMHKGPSAPSEVTTSKDEVKKKPSAPQSKSLKLSLSRKRKQKEQEAVEKAKTDECVVQRVKEESQPMGLIHRETPVVSDMAESIQLGCNKISKQKQSSVNQMDANSPSTNERDLSPCSSHSQGMARPLAGSEKMEQSEDKSSSLDSDEDLDAAIKDLLKTKNKVKRKVRDMKLKARKGTKPTGPMTVDPVKKQKPPTEQKSRSMMKSAKANVKTAKDAPIQVKTDSKGKSKISKEQLKVNKKGKAFTQSSETDKGKGDAIGADGRMVGVVPSSPGVVEDSSSVDSDDSIELEIRKFLAEKAKVTTTATTVGKREELESEGNFLPDKDQIIKLEDQRAEIPTTSRTPDKDCQKGVLSKPETYSDGRADPSLALANQGPALSSQFTFDSSAAAVGAERKRSSDLKDHLKDSPESDRSASRPPSSPTEIPPTQTHQSPVHAGDPRSPSFASTRQNAHCLKGRDTAAVTLLNFYQNVADTPLARGDHKHPLTPGSQLGGYFIQGSPGQTSASLALQTSQISGGVVHMQKDQAAFVELSAHLTNHVQVRSREARQGQEKLDSPAERGRARREDQWQQEQECIDETDMESEEEKRAEQGEDRKQRLPSVSLQRSIDPGIQLSPYIALNTAERSKRGVHRSLQTPRFQCPVKRRLQFVVSMPRKKVK
ncbi:protein phosphatase 1 regulatory subunit 26 [Denticeps clupeoides]|uniref:Protein phosphatase 1 regulatory subunit 26 N-terminal domain-containing protein n=1 Tax=Denticeps clupeoides TaxID=299321 RepID=A0AAY4AC44_9TELE|nr:protein phosphatase 1 regulatory subunit 26 [Denticeps clupeoides]XP_028830459.1 protein phosphatase 1 regulatory subunit 26 [Denticeps clupeoides]